MNINNKYIDKSHSDVWLVYVKFGVFIHSILIAFREDNIRYYITNIPSKMCEANYEDTDKIKNNLKDMITALNIIARLD